MTAQAPIAERTGGATRSQRSALLAIALSQLLVLSVWFSANVVGPQLETTWGLTAGEEDWLTLAVQLGFAAGALGLASLGLADVVRARTLFVVSSLVAAAANGALPLLGPGDVWLAILLRVLTGAALAGVYPIGIKVMSGWFAVGRGAALGVLVGALTLGSAMPHLLRGLGASWQGVVGAASLLAVLGAAVMWGLVRDGPHEVEPQRFSFSHIGRVVRNRSVRLATYGYLGHMWELYAMWAWVASFLTASAIAAGRGTGWVAVAAFSVIAVGSLGAWRAGIWADRVGRTTVVGAALAVSGVCALASPLLYGRSPALALPVLLIWGVAVIADSAQFSALVTELSEPEVRGTALTLQTALGFLLTVASIKLTVLLAGGWGWQWAFPVLAIGPALGGLAVMRLRAVTA